MNADFFVPRGVVIKQENDMLILENPGSIRVGKYQMKLGGQSDPRNKALKKSAEKKAPKKALKKR